MTTEISTRILIVDDEESICKMLSRLISKQMGYYCETYCRPEEALQGFKKGYFHGAILDVRMPTMDGMTLMKKLHESDPNLPIVVLTAFGQWETAVNAVRLGAFNFITKPFDNDEVISVLGHAVQQYEISRDLGDSDELSVHIIGKSPGIRNVLDLIKRVSPTDSTVMISGESGCGKELVARSIHLGSARRHNNFVPVNCGAFPDTLLESEMFGHVKGSFTSSVADKVGMFEVANKGTFFLDEVGETSQMIQVKLLRVLETREVRPLGSTQSKKIDTRIIAATNRDLDAEVKAGNFRVDLFFRLNVIPIFIPPLRERKEDIPLIVGSFIARIAKRMGKTFTASNISPEAWDVVEKYSWPGNIRELENVISRAFTLMKGNLVLPEDLGIQSLIATVKDTKGTLEETEGPTIPKLFNLEKHLEDIEISYINNALELTDGGLTEAAKLLGVSFRTLRYKVRKYGIKRVRR